MIKRLFFVVSKCRLTTKEHCQQRNKEKASEIAYLLFVFLKWNEMKWNEMKWNEMKWNEMKWNEMFVQISEIGSFYYPLNGRHIYFAE